MRIWLLLLAFITVAPSCAHDEQTTSRQWIIQIGVREQRVSMDALGVTDREAWLASRPRIVLDVGGTSLAAFFRADPDDPTQLILEGLFDSGDQRTHLATHAPGTASGLDHNASMYVRLTSDEGQINRTWVALDIQGDPGCGGDLLPTAVSVFDSDRSPLEWDGETVGVLGIRLVAAIPEHDCIVPHYPD